ncbi:MAG TPA: wax ester/triacylglycerol synthase family O-acyltransferase [Acidimicrobiales bacterium]
MTFDRLGPIDTGFLDAECDKNQLNIGALLILEGPPPPFSRLREMVIGKLGLIPRYRQVVRRVPFDLARPVWVDDPRFDIDYHMRVAAVPKPGDMTELRRVVADVMSRRLDQGRPLWELWMVEGLEDDQWALVVKVHHCMADGVGGVELLNLILDPSPDHVAVPSLPWRSRPLPTPFELLTSSLKQAVPSPSRVIRSAKEALADVDELARSLPSLLRVVIPAAPGSLNGPIGPRRRWTTTVVPISEIKKVRSSLGGTFNDVTLAAITRGFRGLLEKRGEPIHRPLRTVVPVSVRARDASGRAVTDGTLENKTAAVFADLPTGVDDPVERLELISKQMSAIKESNDAQGAQSAVSLAKYVPPSMAAAVTSVVRNIPHHNVNTLTTNIPGPQIPLYAVGHPVVSAYPYVPIAMGVRTGVAMLSYNGEVHFGITGDYDNTPDIEIVAEGIHLGMDEMLVAASQA